MNYDEKQKYRKYIHSILDDHLDELGEINLTAVEEDAQDHFHLTDEEFEESEISLMSYDIARRAGKVK